MYKIGIVGYGYVGKGMHRMFRDWVAVVYDPSIPADKEYDTLMLAKELGLPMYQGDSNLVFRTKEDFKNVDLAIVCVPTPMKKSGQCDTSIVEESVKWLYEVGVKLVLIKSTIVPSTTERLQNLYPDMGIAFSPEYMGEGNYFTPMWLYPDPTNPISHGFMVLGGKDEAIEKIANIFVRKMGPHTTFVFLPAKEAEIVKYWENIWGAMKVVFTNQMKDCIQALGGNFYRVREGWAADPRVERMHTAVFEKARGFSGKCYPKDLRAFIYAVEKAGFNPKLLKMIWNLNCEYRPGEFKKIK
jgi:UDPglucose 6-dehydrogenase